MMLAASVTAVPSVSIAFQPRFTAFACLRWKHDEAMSQLQNLLLDANIFRLNSSAT
jgi:hypothetical protein